MPRLSLKQKIFNHVYKFLIKQGEPAKDLNGFCVYKSDNGNKCAVGCLIPDDVYDTDFEEKDVRTVIAEHPGLFPKIFKFKTPPKWFESFLTDLQMIHDDEFWDMDIFKDKMADLAKTHGLTVPTEDECLT